VTGPRESGDVAIHFVIDVTTDRVRRAVVTVASRDASS
jgi:hypothetical protein